MNTKKNKKTNNKIKSLKENGNKEIINISILVFTIIALISLYSKSTGFIGQIIRSTMLSLFGFYGYIIPYVVILAVTLYMLKKIDLKTKLTYIISINLCIIAMIHIIYLNSQSQSLSFLEAFKSAIEFGKLGVGSGIVGVILSYISLGLFGIVGSYILILAIMLISILKLTDKNFFEILRKTIFQLKTFLTENINMFKGIMSNKLNAFK